MSTLATTPCLKTLPIPYANDIGALRPPLGRRLSSTLIRLPSDRANPFRDPFSPLLWPVRCVFSGPYELLQTRPFAIAPARGQTETTIVRTVTRENPHFDAANAIFGRGNYS
jgi:hypothetical protein